MATKTKSKPRAKKLKTLVIVESPTKAKTISRFLSSAYIVESSFGHIRDLPSSSLGINVDGDFAPKYIIPRKKSPAVKILKAAAKKASRIILATDEDREGEAIAWHLAAALNIEVPERIVFHEITKTAIEEALLHPRPLDLHLVDAQQARRVLDRLVGYKLSPFLWKKVMRGLSAGRVQSVALRLIVEREREREAFIKQEYWTIGGSFFTPSRAQFVAELVSVNGKPLEKFDISSEDKAKTLEKKLADREWLIESVEKKRSSRAPAAPFTTSTLQQEASRRLRFSAKQTMMLAQQLYEGIEVAEGSVGLITYMRTDSTNLSVSSQIAACEYLTRELGAEYAMETARVYKTKSKGAQEAHEAIRPSDVSRTPESVAPHLEPKQAKLYELIWRRFVASQMPNAIFDVSTIVVADKQELGTKFRTSGQIISFDGFLKVWKTKSEELELPDVKENQIVSLESIDPTQHFTEPPARFSDATLVKILEKNGIGRPSTYAPTISTIIERGYVVRDPQRRHQPSEVGLIVNDLIVEHFPEIVDLAFTAEMEEKFDEIAEGEKEWMPIIKEFYEPFAKHLEEKYETVEKREMTEPAGEDCPKCGKPMIIRHGRFGRFIACSGFPDCKTTKTLPPKSMGIKCPECNEGDMVERKTRQRRLFYGCSRYPTCKYATWKRPGNPDTEGEEAKKDDDKEQEQDDE
ncbi:MAG: type I DNA topoisomerase [Patescibacteria group bacterium]